MPSIKRPPGNRPLTLDNLRTFATMARCLSFSAAAGELHLTQSAVTRRIQALEDELGQALFARDTRRVALTQAGAQLRQAVLPALDRIDRAVTRLRSDRTRQHVSVSTFGSFATLWLLPRLSQFQATHPHIDIRIVASDQITAMDDPELDVVLRYAVTVSVPPHAERMFDEVLSPVASPLLLDKIKAGQAPALSTLADLRGHALLDQDDAHPGNRFVTWQHWLQRHGAADVQPRQRVSINYGHQIIQAAMAGQGIALGRLGMIHDVLARGELAEPFGPQARQQVNAAYWLIPLPGAVLRPELTLFLDWLRDQAARTREALGTHPS
jgi:LysR family transcriptional regulator, glycine cleavage system transcriptional activator